MANPPEDDARARRPAAAPREDAAARATGPDAISPPTSSIEREPAPPSPAGASGSVAREPRLDPGQVLAERYRIERFIARGGMGEVYEAQDLALGGRVALKTIRPEAEESGRALERFKREIQLARRVTHTNVCRIYDLGTHKAEGGELMFLTMELLRGESLAELIHRRGRLTPPEALPLVEQLTAALHSAHAMGIVHRDLKSANVMLEPGASGAPERVVVTDFGLARAAMGSDELSSLSETGFVVGTPAYMAPEQVQGKPATPQSDIYALGVVLYEMLTGARPFSGGSAMSVAVRRLTEDPRPPRELVHELDERWQSVILRCLAREASQRYATANEVAEALRPGAPEGPSSAVGLPARARRLWFGAALAAALGLASWWLATRPSHEPLATAPPAEAPVALRSAFAVLPLRNASGAPESAWLSTALAEMLTTELASGGGLRAASGDEVARVRRDLALPDTGSLSRESLARLGDALGVKHVVTGSFASIPGEGSRLLRLDLQLRDAASGAAGEPAGATGTESQLFELVARTASALRGQLGLPAPSASESLQAAASFPKDKDAARLYASGLEQLRRYNAVEARDLLRRATEAEPGHPMPHAALATAWSRLGDDKRALASASDALERAGELPELQRQLIRARAAHVSHRWDDAIEAYRLLAEAQPDDLEVGLALLETQLAAARPREARATLDRLRRLRGPAQDPRLDLAEARLHERAGELAACLKSAQAAASKARRGGMKSLLAEARLLEGSALQLSGGDAWMPMLEEGRALFDAAGDRAGVARALELMAIGFWESGEPSAALPLFESALKTQTAVGNTYAVARLKSNIAVVLDDLGRHQQAGELWNQAMQAYRELGAREAMANALLNDGARLFAVGRLRDAQARYQEALPLFQEQGRKDGIADALTNIGEILCLRGELAQARQMHEEALALNREIGRGEAEAFDVYRLAEVFFEQGDLRVARTRYVEALALAEKTPAPLTAARVRLGLGRLSLAEDDAAAAEQALRHAEEVLRAEEVEAPLAQAQAALVEALLAQQKTAEARVIGERLRELALQTQNARARLAAREAALRLAGDPAPRATAQLEALAKEALEAGWLSYSFELRLAAVRAAAGADRAAARSRLEGLASEARGKGLGRVADAAMALLPQ